MRISDWSSDVCSSDLPSTEAPVVADWYSGALLVPDGERTTYVHMGYGSSYERYQVLLIAAGRVVEHLKLSAEEYKRCKAENFEAFNDTGEYRDALEALRDGLGAPRVHRLRAYMSSYSADSHP